jgi:hypothetical protein
MLGTLGSHLGSNRESAEKLAKRVVRIALHSDQCLLLASPSSDRWDTQLAQLATEAPSAVPHMKALRDFLTERPRLCDEAFTRWDNMYKFGQGRAGAFML